MADPILQSPTNPHFVQPLLPGFHSHLNIPIKFFSLHIEGRNQRNTVELRSDACEKTWKVKRDGRRLTVGWKDFAAAHDFRIGDIIIFRHDGDLVFHVTGLGPSCTEIQYVQSCNNDDENNNISNLSRKHNLKTKPESSLDNIGITNLHVKRRIHESFSSNQSCFVAHVTNSNLQKNTLFLPKKFVGLNKGSNKIVLMNENSRRTWTLNLKFRESKITFYISLGWRSFCHANGLEPGDSVTFKLESNNIKTPLLCFSIAESKSVIFTKDSSKGKRTNTGESSQRLSSSDELQEATTDVSVGWRKSTREKKPNPRFND